MPSSTARTARLRSAACAAAGNDRLSPSAMPAAYDTITPFAYRGDKSGQWISAFIPWVKWRGEFQPIGKPPPPDTVWIPGPARKRKLVFNVLFAAATVPADGVNSVSEPRRPDCRQPPVVRRQDSLVTSSASGHLVGGAQGCRLSGPRVPRIPGDRRSQCDRPLGSLDHHKPSRPSPSCPVPARSAPLPSHWQRLIPGVVAGKTSPQALVRHFAVQAFVRPGSVLLRAVRYETWPRHRYFSSA
jgi:hypothetical protein